MDLLQQMSLSLKEFTEKQSIKKRLRKEPFLSINPSYKGSVLPVICLASVAESGLTPAWKLNNS